MTTTPNAGVANTNEFSGVELTTESDAADAFMNLFEKGSDDDASKKKPSDKGEEGDVKDAEDDASETDEETTDAEETETDEDGESPSEEDEETESEEESDEDDKAYVDDEGSYVKVKVGDEEHEVAVKDLKRLYGQEASLTRKSQEVAAKTKEVADLQAANMARLDVLVKRAKEAADPYRQINWAAAMKDPNVSAEEVQALQNMARAAFENEAFLTGQMDGFMQEVRTQQATAHKEAAAACIKSITDEKSPHHIKGWNEPLYNDLRGFGVEMGMPKEVVDQLTDPAAFKLLHMAMQFQRGAKKVVTTKVNKAPKKIVKNSAAKPAHNSSTTKVVKRNEAVSKLMKSGSMDDAVNAFETMFTTGGGE
jgi:hypothetical protein